MSASVAIPHSRIGWVDAGRGLAILLVVLYHSARWGEVAGMDTSGWQVANDILATLRMPLFFMLAGLFAQKWQTARWASLWRAKLSLFIWVFLVWSVIDSFSIMLGFRMQDIEGNYFAQLAQVVWSPLAPRFELWFIWALSLFFVFAKLTRLIPAWVQLTLAAVISAVALSGLELGNVGWNGLLRYYFFFLLGIHGRAMILRFAEHHRLPTASIIIVVWAVLAIAGNLLGLMTLPGFYFVTAVLGVGAGIVFSVQLARFGRLRAIGARTLPIYLTHTSVILVVCYLLHFLVPVLPAAVLSAVAPPVIAAIAAAISFAAARWVPTVPVLRYLYEQPAVVAGRPKKAPTITGAETPSGSTEG